MKSAINDNTQVKTARRAIILAWIAIALALISIALNAYDKYRSVIVLAPHDIKEAPDVRTYGFICNTSDHMLFEQRRESIDVIEYVSVNGNMVNCAADKDDIDLKNNAYLMSNNGFYIINGNKIPRKDVHKEWENQSINKQKRGE
ncbi:hypothetical protein QMI71_004412 [Salmonella enterica]|nr:hypothetical protein [Salmonella enterica]